MRSYQGHETALTRAMHPDASVVRDLQRDLRALGYHKSGLTGVWGGALDAAIHAIRIDLCDRQSSAFIASVNAAGLVKADGTDGPSALEQPLADCIAQLSAAAGYVMVPDSAAARTDNNKIMATVRNIRSNQAPTPFMIAIFEQESGCQHYRVPTGSDEDSYVILGFDHNDPKQPARITSRGWGLGQFTIFHHPPTTADLTAFIDSPSGNVTSAYAELRGKFDNEVVSRTPGAAADDHAAEHPLLGLRLCRYPVTDARYLSDCRNCALATRKVSIRPGQPVYPGSSTNWQTTQYYAVASYDGIPSRADFGCDWPYAVRRYNGGGINSYHYQAHILRNLLS